MWQGIEIVGNSTADQLPDGAPQYQGYVEMINGGTIENAVTAINVGSGGVLRVLGDLNGHGGIFRNCLRGVDFNPYSLGGLYLAPNKSVLRNALFETTTIDPVSSPVGPVHIGINGVGHRIIIEGCQFLDTRTDVPISYSLATGISSSNSNIMVRSLCDTPCTMGRTIFQGLRRGVDVNNFFGGVSARIQNCDFIDNIAAVTANGVTGGLYVSGNTIEVGGRDVPLDADWDELGWEGRHRGIFTTESYGFKIQGNTITASDPAYADGEGIVVGYVRDHNDAVNMNSVSGMKRGYAGEGISASLTNTSSIGLQFLCNLNEANEINIQSRKALTAQAEEQPDHTIRSLQGATGISKYSSRSAQNVFDQVCAGQEVLDFEVTTTYATINYIHRSIVPAEVPECHDGPFLPQVFQHEKGCRTSISNDHPGVAKVMLFNHVQTEKLAYGNTRYQYEQLIDNGNTDEVVQEIISTWPQDVWALRDYLLSKSPYLSFRSLTELIMKPGVPDAIKAEICIANPEATQQKGFVPWLIENSLLPEYLIGSIVASWDQRTYRATLEGEMAERHFEMTQGVNELMELFTADTAGVRIDSLIWAWSLLRTPAARYAEALLHIQRNDFAAADSVVQAIPVEHDLDPKELDERGRMLAYISILGTAHSQGRRADQLTDAEVDQMKFLVEGQNDRPSNWMSKLLCAHYGNCRAAYTGGDDGAPKALPYTAPLEAKSGNWMRVLPNPASTWVAIDHQLARSPVNGFIVIRDITGREVYRTKIIQERGQHVWDSRTSRAGAYMVELRDGDELLLPAQKLILEE